MELLPFVIAVWGIGDDADGPRPQAYETRGDGVLHEGMVMSELLSKLSRETQVVLGGTLLYLVFSFLDWQQVSAFGITAGISEWHGVGVVAGLCAIAVLLWELVRLYQPDLKIAALEQGLVSAGIVLLLVLFTVITFLTHDTARHWPAWLGLVLAVVVGLAGLSRARTEGVKLPPVHTTPPDATAH